MARRPTSPPMSLNKKLVLNQYILSLFGVESFNELAIHANKQGYEGLSEDNISLFHHALVEPLGSGAKLDADTLLAYDANIVAHTKAIQGKRPEPIKWKYFQYLALLFTEIYLDRYMNRQDNLLSELNDFLADFNANVPTKEQLRFITDDDLRCIAFWSATGSGKTLIMHMNIKQFNHHLSKAGRLRDINRTILITPNEGLSHQHLEELKISDIPAGIFTKNTTALLRGAVVEIVEIRKLAERDGDKTVSVDSFEKNNFVLIDEGHRGSSGAVWNKYRRQLAREGFAIEYSATLGQAAAQKKEIAARYAKSILFDYSYRHFYGDGYGKDYRIFNLPEGENNETRELYLTACMLSFYQQKLLFSDDAAKAEQFNIENPLCVFVGSSVNAVRKQGGKSVSDVTDLLLFLARLTAPSNKANVIARIESIKNGSAELTDAEGRQVFTNMFTHITTMAADAIYDDMLEEVFNATAGASLHLDELRGADGEIALRLGNNEDFGVINVGDAGSLCKLCDEHDELEVSSRNFTGSLFHQINDSTSKLHMLIGSKRFSEGWNSWRVSTMGMMNVGRSEGSEVIQLFGRGVRLRGFNRGLKRHSMLADQGIPHNDKLAVLETLNIFGVRANYMEQFKKYLEEGGVPTSDTIIEISLPVKNQLAGKKLKTIKIPEGLNYRRDGGKSALVEPSKSSVKINKVILDYYPQIQSQSAEGVSTDTTAIERNNTTLPQKSLALLDYDSLYFDLQQLKKERGWFNLCISKDAIKPILSDASWYEILIPAERIEFNDWESVRFWQEIASRLLKKHCDQFYKASKSNWEAPHRKYEELLAADPNFILEHKLYVDESKEELITQIKHLRNQINSNPPKENLKFGPNKAIFFCHHLYQPLVALGNQDLRIQPAGLNKGEEKFVESLRSYILRCASSFSGKEIYLLRNLTRGKGVGFFEAGNFYPDFILWLIDGDKQTIVFIDPKGLMRLSPSDPKLNFHSTIKEIEEQMGDSNVQLNSFIISVSSHNDIKDRFGGMSETQFADKNIFFQEKPDYIDRMFKKIIDPN